MNIRILLMLAISSITFSNISFYSDSKLVTKERPKRIEIVEQNDLGVQNKLELLKTAKFFLGTKYLYGAKSGDTKNFDCSSFVQLLYKNIDINLPRTSREQEKLGENISIKDLQIGDLIFFNDENYKRVSHVGMYIGNNYFVHASSKAGKVIVSELKNYYLDHYVSSKRIMKENGVRLL